MSQSPDNRPIKGGTVRRILVVDDEPTLRLGFSYSLSNQGNLVDTASTGRQALEKIAKSSYDIVILDLRMPDIDGFGVIEALRGAGNMLPIVLCSAAITPSAILRALRHGVPDFLQKPVRPIDLREVVDFVLDPPDTPYSRALAAIRCGEAESAMALMSDEAPSQPRAEVWSGALQYLLKDGGTSGAASQEDLLSTTLSSLAFRSSTTPR